MNEPYEENDVIRILEKAKSENFPFERILSSMCTRPHPIAVRAHSMFIESNLGDPGLFPGVTGLEDEVIKMLGSLLHKPDAKGYITTGGTESNIQAIRAVMNTRGRGNIIVPESAHFSFDKISNLLGIGIKKADSDEEFKVDVGSVESLIDEKTIGLVGIAGTSEHGQIDPIPELSRIAVESNLFLHVDAAFGGFVIPFLRRNYKFDFSLPGVSSISIDPHKMGMSVIPSGALLFRDESYLRSMDISTPYLTSKSQFTLTGTRSGASAAATYAVMKHLGWNGFERIVKNCMELTNRLIERTTEFGFHPVIEPVMNVVNLKVPKTRKVVSSLEKKGWKVSMTRDIALRLVIMPHVTKPILDSFLDDLRDVVDEMALA